MSKIRKNIELQKDVNQKLEQIVAYENASLEEGLKESQTSVINKAIELYHSKTFGEDILINGLEQLDLQVTNTISNVMKEYMEVLVEAYNSLNESQELQNHNLEMQNEVLVSMFRTFSEVDIDNNFDAIFYGNIDLRNAIELAVKRKRNLGE